MEIEFAVAAAMSCLNPKKKKKKEKKKKEIFFSFFRPLFLLLFFAAIVQPASKCVSRPTNSAIVFIIYCACPRETSWVIPTFARRGGVGRSAVHAPDPLHGRRSEVGEEGERKCKEKGGGKRAPKLMSETDAEMRRLE